MQSDMCAVGRMDRPCRRDRREDQAGRRRVVGYSLAPYTACLRMARGRGGVCVFGHGEGAVHRLFAHGEGTGSLSLAHAKGYGESKAFCDGEGMVRARLFVSWRWAVGGRRWQGGGGRVASLNPKP